MQETYGLHHRPFLLLERICSPFIAGRGESMPTDSTGEKRCRTTTAEATAKFKQIANETETPQSCLGRPSREATGRL
jgi:hypothetical protein